MNKQTIYIPTEILEESLFTTQEVDEECNKPDLQNWVDNGQLDCLIDEEQGGIIGYIHHHHIERITNKLNQQLLKKEAYIFTPEELKQLLSDAFKAGENYENQNNYFNAPDEQEYIENLLNKEK